MGDIHAYRASDELAAALHAYRDAHREVADKIRAWDAEHPGTEIVWRSAGFSADPYPAGFKDGHDDVPAGLSRAKSRTYLTPSRGKAGAPWRVALGMASRLPKVALVFREFEVPPCGFGPHNRDGTQNLAPTRWVDAGADGVLVVCAYDLTNDDGFHGADPTRHLTPIPLSEFYAIKERLESEQAASTESTP